MKRALVLSGGGAKGSFQVGALKSILSNDEKKLDFHIIKGVSVGALNGAILAQAKLDADPVTSWENLKAQYDVLRSIWDGIKGNDDIYHTQVLAEIRLGFDLNSLYTREPLEALVIKYIDETKLQNSGRKFTAGVVSLPSGNYTEFGTDRPAGPATRQMILASTAIPDVFPIVDTGSDVLVDGGVRNITPLAAVYEDLRNLRKETGDTDPNPDEIHVVLTNKTTLDADGVPDQSDVPNQDYKTEWKNNWLGTKVNGIKVLGRSVDIVCDQIMIDDLRTAVDWNFVAKGINQAKSVMKEKDFEALDKTLHNKRFVKLFVYYPTEFYGCDNKNDDTNFSGTFIQHALLHGELRGTLPAVYE